MPELREELLGTTINKKRILAIALVIIILIGMFAFSVTLISFLFGSQRPFPSRQKEFTEDEDPLLIKPPYPFDEDFWQDLLDQVDDPTALLDMLSEMLDGDIDDLDLSNFSQGLLDLLFTGAGEMEVFRVFNATIFPFNMDINQMSDVLWKYECFDEYTGEGWTSNAGSNIYDFYSYGDYLNDYFPNPELFKIKMPLSPDIGINSMVLPTFFPTPFVLDHPPDSIYAPTLDPGSPTLYKDDYNSTTIDLSFSSDIDVNMTFEILGLYKFLPTNNELNSSAVKVTVPNPKYLSLQSKYLQLPPTINVYKSNNPYFATHFNILNGIIKPNDNPFWVANKIRNYLQANFSFPMDPNDYNPAPEGRDIVDWFCETRQGVWSDFASAFCAFSRAFGIVSRFVDGFNSFLIENIWDNDEAQWGFAIKYKNLYNWAEIYVPTDIFGNGQWVQFDIFDSFAGGGNPIIGGNYNITVTTDQLAYTRPDTATITATVINTTITDPIDGLTITFTDTTTGQDLGQNVTDINGKTSVLFNINNSHVVGPHVIEARYDLFSAGYNITSILGDISVALTNINPEEINISDAQPDSTNILGYLVDPLNGKRIKEAEVNILLFQKGTIIEELNAFTPSSIVTDDNGDFNDILDLNPSVSAGQYEIRADFNGRWWIDLPYLPPFPWDIPVITNSSNRMEFNVTKDLDVWFYIDGISTNFPNIPPNYPIVSRIQTLNLTARVISVTHGPMSNKQVSFYDYTRGDIMIGSAISDINGYASINYPLGSYNIAGPNLLYARIGSQENYSYFVLNEEPTINIISGPNPRVVNRTGSGATQFNIEGEIFDNANNSLPISFSEITLTLLKDGTNYSYLLVPSGSYQTGSTGKFDLTYGVNPNTPPGNYTLRLDFNGTINLSSYPYSYRFNLPFLNTSTNFINELQIDAPASLQFNFWIDGTPSYDYNNPIITRGGVLNLSTYIQYGGIPIANGEWVYFYDVTQDDLYIGADQTNGGFASINYFTDNSTTAGPHLIYATWNNRYNYSYFILDAPILIDLDIGPVPSTVYNDGQTGRTFIISGYLNDSLNGNPIKYGEISVHLLGQPDIYLIQVGGSVQLNDTGRIFVKYNLSSSTPEINHTVQVWFNGTFLYSSPNNIFNEHNFYLWGFSNFSNWANEINLLQVLDPFNIDIYFWINGSAALPTYNDFEGNFPEWYYRGDTINFTVFITQSDFPVLNYPARIYNMFNNSYLLDSYDYTGLESPQGFHTFLIDTSSWHAGIHYIKVNWSTYGTFNTTYVIINEKIDIFTSIDRTSITRNSDSFSVSGTVQESGVLLRGLQLNIVLLDSTFTDVSGLYLLGSATITIDNDGTFQFFNFIALACPQGEYYLNITFTGGMDDLGIFQTDYMVHSNASLIPINITAGTYIIEDSWYTDYDFIYPEYSDRWIINDTLHVNGILSWDNGSVISGMTINVTVKLLDGTIIAFNDTVQTDSFGVFNVSIFIDEYAGWPDFRVESEIWVYFDPVINNAQYVEGSENEFT